MRVLAAAALLAALASPAAASPAALPAALPAAGSSAAPAVPELAGVVTLSGSTTGYVPVRLPSAATLVNPSLAEAPPLVEGGGRYVGFVLTDTRPGGIRIQGGRQEGSKFGDYAIAIQGLPSDGTFDLPAGDYRLYLLADGAPATVTLRFDGLSGSAALAPATAVPYVLESPDVLLPPGGTYSTGGAESTLEGDGLAFDFLTDRNGQFLASNTTLCFYEGDPPPPPVGYGPGCPGGSPAPLTTVAPGAGATEGAAFSAIADLAPGRYGLGFNRVVAGVTADVTYTVGFLTFDAAGAAVEQPPGTGTGTGSGETPPPSRRTGRVTAPETLPASGLPGSVAVIGAVAAAAAVRARRLSRS